MRRGAIVLRRRVLVAIRGRYRFLSILVAPRNVVWDNNIMSTTQTTEQGDIDHDTLDIDDEEAYRARERAAYARDREIADPS